MRDRTRKLAPVIVGIASMLLAGCATKGALKKAVLDQQTALAAERTERVAADSATQQDVAAIRNDQQSLRNDLQALRSDLQSLRSEYGVGLSGEVYELPLHQQPVFAPWVDGPLPEAEQICASHICLPVSAVLTDEQAEIVVESLRSVLGQQPPS